jgi:antitoxin MazE
MRAKLVRIGNSKGIRLPKPVIEQVGLTEEVELEVRDGAIVITPGEETRKGWAEAAQALVAHGEDQLLDEPLPTAFDAKEWNW